MNASELPHLSASEVEFRIWLFTICRSTLFAAFVHLPFTDTPVTGDWCAPVLQKVMHKDYCCSRCDWCKANLSLQYDKSQVLACSYVLSNEVVVASCLFLEIHIPDALVPFCIYFHSSLVPLQWKCVLFLPSSDDMKRIKYCRNICLCLEARHWQGEKMLWWQMKSWLEWSSGKNRARLICHAYNLALVQRVFSLWR